MKTLFGGSCKGKMEDQGCDSGGGWMGKMEAHCDPGRDSGGGGTGNVEPPGYNGGGKDDVEPLYEEVELSEEVEQNEA